MEKNRKTVERVIKKDMACIVGLFIFILVLSIIWRQMVLGNHGFPKAVFSFPSWLSVLAMLLVSAIWIGLNRFDDAYCKGILKAVIWNILSYITFIYVIKRDAPVPRALEMIYFPICTVTLTGVWILLKKRTEEIGKGCFLILTIASLLIMTLIFFFVKTPWVQVIGIMLLLTAILYAAMLLKESVGLKYTGILLCVILYTLYSSYLLGEYGKTVIQYNEKEYKVLYMDIDGFLYCEGEENSILIQNIEEAD